MNLIETEKDKFDPKWWSLIGHHFGEKYMLDIYTQLRDMNRKKHVIFPMKDQIYKQFKDCKFDDVLVCFIVPKPIIEYHKNLCWQYMTILLELDCYNGLNLDCHDDMNYLMSQGIIHIPVSMTYSRHTEHTHLGWQSFTKDCIKHLNNSLNKILFIYEDSCILILQNIKLNYYNLVFIIKLMNFVLKNTILK